MRIGAPFDPERRAGAAQLLPCARAAAQDAGVTRLAELTRLDKVGLPVWQAVRPMSRALSVHQGKGGSDEEAQLGALLEAVESHWAEKFEGDGPTCRFRDLPEEERPPTITDFAARRDRPSRSDQTHRWIETRDLLTGNRLHLPFELASLDFTRHVPSRFDRASNGVATGATREEAIAVALHELIERDAVTEWHARGLLHCTASTLRSETIPFDWFRFWADRLESLGIALHCYRVPSVNGSPVFLCEVREDSNAAAAYRTLDGRGCHAIPELALFKALAEAVQARATYIAGAREDLRRFYGPARPSKIPVPYGLPLPAGMRGVAWADVRPGPRGAEATAGSLAVAGYARIAVIDLAKLDGLHVVRAFVYGLGSFTRRRRAPEA